MQERTDDLLARDREARLWLADPHRYFKAFSRTARRFQHTHPSPRYRVMTLVGGPQEFLSRRPLRLHFMDRTTPVDTWADVFAAVVREIAVSRPVLLRALEMRGLIPWLVKENPAADVVDAFNAGAVTLRLATLEEAFQTAQWIALMAGVKLNEVIVQVDPFTDEEWRVRAAEIQAKRQEENRMLREIDLARRHYAETHTDEFTPPSLGESSTTW